MKNKPRKIILSALIVSVVIAWTLQVRCDGPSDPLNIASHPYINYLYPAPNAKVSFACSTWAFLKSPLAPQQIELVEHVFREDGLYVLRGYRREGVVVAHISVTGRLYHLFPERVRWGEVPPFVNAVSLYVDGKEFVLLKGETIKDDFINILEDYLKKRFSHES